MTKSTDFTPEEWERISQAPVGAGLLVATASRGGTFRESFSIAKAYGEVRTQHGASELLDELVAHRPKVDRGGAHSESELHAHHIERLREAVTALEAKATPEELDQYRSFVNGLAERVARAHEEDGHDVTPEEQAVVDEIAATLGS
jgi:hypothetical protein